MEQITLDIKKIKVVDTNTVRVNSWNPKDENTEEYKNVVESIRVKGLRKFIVVRENDGYEVIDGEQRLRACNELGFKQVIIYNEGVMSDKEAKELTLQYQIQVPFNNVDLAKMVTSLMMDFPDAFVPYSKEKIKEMSELVKFNWEDYKADNKDKDFSKITTLVVPMTDEQYKMLQDAIAKIKEEAGQDITDGRALELMAGDYLAGFGVKEI